MGVLGKDSLVYGVLESPATAGVVALCVGVWAWLLHRNADHTTVGLSYRTLVEGKQYWRVLTATVSHIDLLHLGFNMSSLWSLRFVEVKFGSLWYARLSLLLMLGSVLIFMGVYHLVIRFGSEESREVRDSYAETFALGYSCVVFGIMTVAQQLSGRGSMSFLGLVNLPLSLAPFGSLLLTQLIVPRASFLGHLSGIIVGYIYSWGLLSWFDTQCMVFTVFWLSVLLVYSLKTTTHLDLRFLTVLDSPSEPLRELHIDQSGVLSVNRGPPPHP